MSTLAHVFEAEGLATVALGSQRNQIEHTAPPRGLWCDFPLGRPLGRPADPAFQHRVLRQRLRPARRRRAGRSRFPRSDPRRRLRRCWRARCLRRHDGVHPAVDEARGLRPAYERAVARVRQPRR